MTVLAGPFVFARGETLALALVVESGDPSTITSATAKMRRLKSGDMADAPVNLSVTFVAAAAGQPASWLLSLAAATSSTLEPGSYQVDARFVQAGKVDITDSAQLRIVEAASSS